MVDETEPSNEDAKKGQKKIDIKEIPKIAKQFPKAFKKSFEIFGGSSIPLTLIFEALGYSGMTGIGWGLLTGAIVTAASELGYEVYKSHRLLYIRKKQKSKEK